MSVHVSALEHELHQSAVSTLRQLKQLFASRSIQHDTCFLMNDVINVLSCGDLRIAVHGSTLSPRTLRYDVSVRNKSSVFNMFKGPTNVWIFFALDHSIVFTDFSTICANPLFASIYDSTRLPVMIKGRMVFEGTNLGPEMIICNLDSRSVHIYCRKPPAEIRQSMQIPFHAYPHFTFDNECWAEWWSLPYSPNMTYGMLFGMSRPVKVYHND